MPLTGSEKNRFEEFGKGKTYAKTEAKFGKAKADKQRIAVVMNSEGKSMKKDPKKADPKKSNKKDGKFIQKATEKMREKGTVGAFGKATPKKIAHAKKEGGLEKKRAVFAQNMKKIAEKHKRGEK